MVRTLRSDFFTFYESGVHEWGWVHERLFMPEGTSRGYKQRSCTQSHSWTLFIHQFMMDHPSYAIILQIHTFNLPKIHENPPFILPLSTFKSSRKIGDLLGMYQISTNIDYWQGHERNLYMVTCGLLTNHRHGNHVLMYEQWHHHTPDTLGTLPDVAANARPLRAWLKCSLNVAQ